MLIRALILFNLLILSDLSIAQDQRFKQCGDHTQANLVTDGDDRVHLFRDAQEVYADRVQYSEKHDQAIATGNVLVLDPELDFTASQAEMSTVKDEGTADEVTYWYHSTQGSGIAKTARRVAKNVIELDDATYSTCDFSQRSWEMSAKHTTLDLNAGVGTSRNVTGRFMGVPVFYSPWLSFPLNDKRKTGFLTPELGRSSSSGTEFETPFYWNIAANKDALIVPRYLSKRGTQLSFTGRYINPDSSAQTHLQFLDDSDYDDERYLISFRHRHAFGHGFYSNMIYNKVSDDEYFEDLSDSIGLSSTQRLERRGELGYNGSLWGGQWQGFVRMQQYQIVDSEHNANNDPYKRLPQIQLRNSYANLPAGFELNTSSEWVAFDHDDKVDGNRTHLFSELARPFRTAYSHFTPALRVSHTRYDLSGTTGDETPVRSVPSVSLDSGLVFERHAASADYRQTLEPRLFYLYTPHRKHDDIPLFDTGEYEFSFRQLFRTNRYSNADRIADANQLTAAITSRYVSNQTGRELFRASLGTIFYFDQNEVTLKDNDEVSGDNNSDLAAELAINFNDRWQAISAVLWDTQTEEFNRTNINLRYQSSDNLIVNLGHRFRRDDFSQSDLSLIYPMTQNWRAVGRWNYDFKDDRDLDLLAGIEYDTCCWNLRVAARRFTNDNDGDYNKSLEVQWTLKGLTTLGSSINELLMQNIRGYEEHNTYVY